MPSHIEWTQETWNPLAGCTPVSEGCRWCYAAKDALRLASNPNPKIAAKYAGTAVMRGSGRNRRAVFTGQINLAIDDLAKPLRWRRPRMVFVNSMSDLFHEAVAAEFIARVFAVMAQTPQHTYQILTKRPWRMAEWASRRYLPGAINDAHILDGGLRPVALTWPLPNVWLGTSVEDQAAADERIPHLLRTPAAIRFLSCEPLLGPLDLDGAVWPQCTATREEHDREHDAGLWCDERNVDWVIVGGESGPGARPMDLAWARSIVRLCLSAGIPVFYKQGGSHNRCSHSSKGGCLECMPPDLRVREFPVEA